MMYVILFLVSQVIFGVEIGGSELRRHYPQLLKEDMALTTQEPWRENFKDVFEDINIFSKNITIFTKDWISLDVAIDKIKDQLIQTNIDFEITKNDWPETNPNYYNIDSQKNRCDSIIYTENEKLIIQNQYTVILKTLTKPLDFQKNYISETLQSLNNQLTVLKGLLPFKVRNCGLNCTNERKGVLDEMERNKMILEDLNGKTINVLELLRIVSYNINKQKYTTRTEWFNLQNKYACCSLKKITCAEVSTEITFEPLDFESLLRESTFQSPYKQNIRILTLSDFLKKSDYDNDKVSDVYKPNDNNDYDI